MFIKKTLKTDSKSGKSYCAYHLVESVRTDKGPRQRILLYMGADIAVPEGEHKLLAQRIEEIITLQPVLIPCQENIEKLAQMYASQLINRLSNKDVDTNPPETKTTSQELVKIDLSSMEMVEPRSVGAEHLLLHMAEQLQLPKKLRDLGLSETELPVALSSIIARAVNPASERATHMWLQKESGLGELLDFDFQKASLDKFYNISDELLKHKDDLETHLES